MPSGTPTYRSLATRPAANIHLVGGRLCLDFVNSVGARRVDERGNPRIRDEKLSDYADLVAWGWHAGLVSRGEAASLVRAARRRPMAAAGVFSRAIRLREALHAIALRAMSGGRPRTDSLTLLNAELARARSSERLAWRGRNAQWHWRDVRPTLDRLICRIAQSAADLLTHGDLSRLRACGGDDCGWLFEDTSRNRRRRWCDMRDCGNVAKMRRFRDRRRDRDGSGCNAF